MALWRWHAKRAVIPMLFQWLQRSCFLPGHHQICFPRKYLFRTKKYAHVDGILWNLAPELFLRILTGPWPARAGNPNIPIGILRFLSLPGSHGLLPNTKNLEICAQITFFLSKTGFSASGAKKNAPERYVYVGFWAGAANVDF